MQLTCYSWFVPISVFFGLELVNGTEVAVLVWVPACPVAFRTVVGSPSVWEFHQDGNISLGTLRCTWNGEWLTLTGMNPWEAAPLQIKSPHGGPRVSNCHGVTQ